MSLLDGAWNLYPDGYYKYVAPTALRAGRWQVMFGRFVDAVCCSGGCAKWYFNGGKDFREEGREVAEKSWEKAGIVTPRTRR
jgi:hypothetical protein